MKFTLEDLRIRPHEVTAAARVESIEVVGPNGDTRFWLSIPGRLACNCEDAAEARRDRDSARMEAHRLRTENQVVDVEHIRLRDGLRRAIAIAAKERPCGYENIGPDADDEREIAELRKLVQP